jgi:uncharacterized iron-regulated membrane protein
MWGVTGMYSSYPLPFQQLVNRLTPLYQYRFDFSETSMLQASPEIKALMDLDAQPRPRGQRAPRRYSRGDMVIRWFSWLHFGNFAGWRTKAVWLVLGLAPPFLFITGLIMWWNRVLSPAARRLRRKMEPAEVVAAAR